MNNKSLELKQNMHELGIDYVQNLLDRAGFTIQDVNKDLNHHFQLFAKVNDRALLIAIRTARRPDVGTMDEETRKKLIAESERLNAVPHFAGLSLTPLNVTEAQVDGITKNREYEVVFNGMTVVR